MKTTLALILAGFISLLPQSSHAGEARVESLKLVPNELVELLGKDYATAIQKIKSKVTSEDKGQAIYLNYFGGKGDVTLGLKNNVVSYLYLEFTPENAKKFPDLFKKATKWLTPEELKKQADEASEDSSHEAGRYITYEIPNESIKLEFSRNDEHSIHSMIVWPVGEKVP